MPKSLSPATAALLADIMAFCDAEEVSPSRFGELAMNDKAFVFRLGKGRRCWPDTEARVREFMASRRSEAQADVQLAA